MIADHRSRIKARDFLDKHLADVGLKAPARRRLEKKLAWAFWEVRHEVATQIESTWGTAQWMEYSKAIAARVRKL